MKSFGPVGPRGDYCIDVVEKRGQNEYDLLGDTFRLEFVPQGTSNDSVKGALDVKEGTVRDMTSFAVQADDRVKGGSLF